MIPDIVQRAANEAISTDGAEAGVALVGEYYDHVLHRLLDKITDVVSMLEAGAPTVDVLEALNHGADEARAAS